MDIKCTPQTIKPNDTNSSRATFYRNTNSTTIERQRLCIDGDKTYSFIVTIHSSNNLTKTTIYRNGHSPTQFGGRWQFSVSCTIQPLNIFKSVINLSKMMYNTKHTGKVCIVAAKPHISYKMFYKLHTNKNHYLYTLLNCVYKLYIIVYCILYR